MADRRSFWSSVPGFVTGAAGLVTAIVGLLTISVQAGWLGDGNGGTTSTSTRPGTATTSPGGTVTTGTGASGAAGAGSFEVTPRTLELGAVGGSTGVVTVENTGATPLNLMSVEVEGARADAFEVDASQCTAVTLRPGRTCDLRVKTVTGALGGRSEATLVVAAEGGAPVREVDLVASGLLG